MPIDPHFKKKNQRNISDEDLNQSIYRIIKVDHLELSTS
jgi:hypothetical protein